MNNASGDLNFLWAYAFVDALARLGVATACIAPGSRCTPLTLALTSHSDIEAFSQIDERSCGFFGLGHAKVSGRPVMLVCTSGTAAANFFPSVIEAFYSEVPLIICTADRPPDLHERGANQTIDQQYLYGNKVRWFQDTGLPQKSLLEEGYIVSLAERAYANAMTALTGPVHVNFPFRKPLEPNELGSIPRIKRQLALSPVSFASPPKPAFPEDDLENVLEMIRRYNRGIILVGPSTYDIATLHRIEGLAQTAGYPILADGLSQLRFGPFDRQYICHYSTLYVNTSLFIEKNVPEIIIRFGRQPTSSALNTYLETQANAFQVLINETGRLDDATHSLDTVIKAPVTEFCQAATTDLQNFSLTSDRIDWLNVHQKAEQKTEAILTSVLEDSPSIFEGKVYRELPPLLPDNSQLMISNSLPVRDLDQFAPPAEQEVRVFFNRGVSGIDGITSTALGIAAAGKSPTVLVTGDLAFYHDLTGLRLASGAGINLTIILIHNNGGGIFEMLPISRFGKLYQEFVQTPHNLDFDSLVRGFHGLFTAVETWEDFHQAVKNGLEGSGLNVIQVTTDAKQSMQERQRIKDLVSHSIEEQFG